MAANLVKTAQRLRRNHTDAERLLWRHLRNRQIEGVKFRRQQLIGRFIVDFVSFEKRMVIEVDGGQHSIEKDKDVERDLWLGQQGFKVLRFWNNEVLQNPDGVFEVIREHCLDHPHPSPPPSRGRGSS